MNIPAIDNLMLHLESLAAKQRNSPPGSIPRDELLLQVSPTTGRILRWLVSQSPAQGALIELGTSGGYSTLWLTLGLMNDPRTLHTWEISPHKIKLAAEHFSKCEVNDRIQIHDSGAEEYMAMNKIAFCFLDTYKDMYLPYGKIVLSNLVPGGLLIADNIISHKDELTDFLQYVQSDPGIDSVIVPVDSGLLLARRHERN